MSDALRSRKNFIDYSDHCKWLHSCGLVLVVAIFSLTTSVSAAQPGELSEYRSSGLDGLKLSFRYCPSGEVFPGRPSTAEDGIALGNATPIRDFYIGQTEVTLAQYRAVMGDAGLMPLKRQAAKLRANPQLFETIQQGQGEPAFLVDLNGAVGFCVRLQNDHDQERRNGQLSSIESRLFRLPSHVEWQYAARAVSSTDSQGKTPHFFDWIKYQELSPGSQEKCKELWQSLGKTGPFPGDQESFLTLSVVTSGSDTEKLRDILTEVFQKTFGSPPRSASGMGSIQVVGMTPPNAWNLTDTLEGVPEWAIWARDRNRAHKLWNRISSQVRDGKSLEGVDDIFLCGGSSFLTYSGSNDLARFTVWGGPKLTGGQPQPFTNGNTIVEDFLPGFRVVMERVLADDWLFVVRRGVFRERGIAANARQFVTTSQQLADEFVETGHPSRMILAFYEDLATSTPTSRSRLSDRVSQVATMTPNIAGSNAPTSAADKLKALLKKPNTAVGSEQPSDEQLFFRTLAGVMHRSAP